MVYASNERDPRYFDLYMRTQASGETRLVWQQDSTNFPSAISPDGARVLISRIHSNILTQLFVLDLASGAARALTPESADGPAEFLDPCWSADDQSLYILSNRGRGCITLARLDLATGEQTCLYDELWDIDHLCMSPDGQRLALIFNEEGYSHLELLGIAQGRADRHALPLPELSGSVIADLAWSPDGQCLAFTLYSAGAPMDIRRWDIAQEQLWQATRSSPGGIARASFVEPTLIHSPTFDRREVPAFLFLPREQEERPLPIVIHVHGGPEGQALPIFNPVIQYLIAQGYTVLTPNVRGSGGYGSTYYGPGRQTQTHGCGSRSAACRALAARQRHRQPPAHCRHGRQLWRLYGSLRAHHYPDLWAAGVDIVGIANFVTFLEHIHLWRRKLRESDYGSLEHDRDFLAGISPIRRVEQITAPLLVIHGANDPRVPIEYLRFADEGHGLVKPPTA